ncbi:hypothetical protein [Phytoactinopolyspora endophytica]|uniref:hypothetical protein n=1 Tax=Phytoactinopolyspora endophytica TaxID=1642495 RepID=UPI00101CED41|nr:hypothetical protein [Phytoactinopolyspora endophytica]
MTTNQVREVPRPDVVTAAWDVLTAHDEIRRTGTEFDALTRDRRGRPIDWDAFCRWRDVDYVPAHALLASALATLTALVGSWSGDAIGFCERLVAADVDASLTDAARAAA